MLSKTAALSLLDAIRAELAIPAVFVQSPAAPPAVEAGVCPDCKAPRTAKAKFCGDCGAKLEAVP